MAKEKSTAKKGKKPSPKDGNGVNNIEIFAVIIFAASIFTGISLYCPLGTAGALGDFIHNLLKGLFGMSAYTIAPVLIANIIYTVFYADGKKSTLKYIISALAVLDIAAICHMIFLSANDGITWNMYYTYSQIHNGGGILGACIAKPLCMLLGNIGTYILLYALLLIWAILLFNVSPVKVTKKLFAALAQFNGSAAQSISDMREANKQKREQKKKEKQKKKSDLVLKDLDKEQKLSEYTYEKGEFAPDAEEELPYEKEDEVPALGENLTINLPGESEHIQEEKAEKLTDNEKQNLHSEIEKEMEIHVENTEKVEYVYPSIDLLTMPKPPESSKNVQQELKQNAVKLVETLKSFGVDTTVVEISQGPTITRYEVKPAAGVRVNQITSLAGDVQLSLAAKGVIIAPVPGKSTVGIEIANKNPSIVSLREVIESDEFKNHPSKLAVALGKDISGKPIIMDLAKMPHLLIAGATGAGKSVCINTLVISMLYKADPSEVKLVMIDPKQVELGIYNGIPHLLIPVVKDAKKATGALSWAVQEMTERYSEFERNNVRNIKGYNDLMIANGTPEKKMPSIVILIDEFADLMMVAPGDVENYVCRIAQLARAAGMHLVIATQRPVVKFITGNIKANIPSRIAFMVASNKDSQTILDMGGADKLIGKGDMLYLPVGETKPKRMQCAFVSDSDVKDIVEAVSHGVETVYNPDIMEKLESEEQYRPDGENPGDADELLPEAIEMAIDNGQISTSLLQRRFRIGYNRAGSIIDQMEARGIIGGLDGNKPRQVLINREQYNEMVAAGNM